MVDGYEQVPQEMNVPIECTSCGSLFQLFGPEDGSDLCECEDPMFRIFVSDAGKYAPVLEVFVDTAEDRLRQIWSETNRDDLERD